jgi:hypothetical protein
MKVFWLFFFSSIISNAQVTLKGQVVDVLTLQVIPYATIGLMKQNSGGNADQNGFFTINCKYVDDTVFISSVGYQTEKFSVQSLKVNTTIKLNSKPKLLKEVVVRDLRSSATINDNNCEATWYLTSDGKQFLVAQLLQAPTANTLLQSIKLCMESGQGKSVFRIRIFDYDSMTRGPGEELTDTAIQVAATSKDNSFNLEPFRIFLPQKLFFVSIEWLILPINDASYRAKYNGKKSFFLDYKPHLGMGSVPESHLEVWELAYSNHWRSVDKSRLLVSAIIKF